MRMFTKTVLIGSCLAVAVGGSTLFFSHRAIHHSMVRSVADGAVLSVSNHKGISAYLSGKSEWELLKHMEILMDETGASSIAVLDRGGKVAVHTNVVEVGKVYDDPFTAELIRGDRMLFREVGSRREPFLVVGVPLYEYRNPGDGEEFLLGKESDTISTLCGYIVLKISLNRILDVHGQIAKSLIWIVTLTFCVGMLVALLFLKRMLIPVRQLSVAVRRIGEGKFGQTVPVLSKDEIGTLAMSFNHMSEILARTVVSKDYVDAILKNMLDPLLVTDLQGNMQTVNKALCVLLEYEEGELLGRPVESLFLGNPGGIFTREKGRRPEVTAVFRSRDLELMAKSGRRIPVLFSGTSMRDVHGNVVGYVGVAKDITDRKAAEENVRASKRQLDRIVNSVADPIFVLDRQHRFVLVNDEFTKITDSPRERTIGKSFHDIVPKELAVALWEKNEKVFATGAESVEEELVRWSASTERWSLTKRTTFQTENGEHFLVGVISDLTTVKQAQDAIIQSEWKLKKSLEGSTYGIWDLDLETSKFGFSESLCRILEQDPASFALDVESWKAIVHPDDLPWVAAQLESYLRGERPSYEAEYRVRTKSGKYAWVFVRGQIGVRSEDGRPLRMFGAFEDVTERRESEEERRRMSLVIEQAAESVVITDPAGNILYVNPAFEKISGYGRAEVLGRKTNIVKSDKHDRMFYAVLWNTVLRGDTWQGRITNQRKDGSLVEEESIISPIKDKTGKIVALVSIQRDITEQVALERQLFQSQKMEAVGRLAGGVAHDFNNLLTSILGFSQMALDRLGPDNPVSEDIQEIVKAGERAAALTQQLLAFSRKQVVEPKVLDMGAAVADTEGMLRRLIGEDIKLQIAQKPSLWPVKVDPNQLGQVLINLAVNARDAMPKGGRLTIALDNVSVEESISNRNETIKAGDYVTVSMTDTGSGMSENTLSHLFEPFFTTKPKGKGTGLGLATIYGIIKQNGGYITVYSEVDKGTTFRVYLPRHTAGAPAAAEAPAPADGTAPSRRDETILLVEDEGMVLSMSQRALESRGFKVLPCDSGRRALEVLKEHGDRIHLMLTDVVMPEMSGPELAKRVAEMRPDVKILFMSGYTDDMIAAHGVLEEGTNFIQKPFTPSALVRKVQDVLK